MMTDVRAPVTNVWEVLMDSSYIPKLYPDVLTASVDPPGKNRVGQRFHIVAKAGRRKLEIFAETREVVERKKVVTRQTPGGLFASFDSTIELDPQGESTKVLTTFDYELSMGYLGKIFNMVLLERLVSDNLKAYATNLKEICELLPLE